MTGTTHLWLRLPRREDLPAALDGLDLPRPLTAAPLSAHRRLRGPYTFGGELARELTPGLLATAPDLVRLHEVTLLTLAPELRDHVEATKETLTSLAVPAERTRFYSRLRTLRLAHGMTALLRDRPQDGPVSLVVRDAHHADPTDAELLAVLLRRLDPERVRLVVCTGLDELGEPVTPMPETLPEALHRHAHRVDAIESTLDEDVDPAAYVHRDGVADDPRLVEAYLAADPADRARWHDARAEHLETAGFAWRLGAIPYHREHGGDPVTHAVPALRLALDHCIDAGFYDATVDLGERGRRYVDADGDVEQWWAFTTKMTTSLAALARAEDAERLYDEARAASTSPAIHQQAAYATAMLYTRHHETDVRDDRLAKAWINQAIAFAALDPDPPSRAFHSAFYRNGLALIELHLGDPQQALDLVEDGLRRLDTGLDADRHRLHRSVLRYNRAQVLAGLGRVAEALTDYDTVIALDPNYPEYHFDRAALLRRLGRDDDALADYDEAIRLSPPFPEAYFNRAVTRAGTGDTAGALADLAETIALDPANVDAYVNRAELLLEAGDTGGAAADVAEGLRRDPERPELHVLAGHLADDGAAALRSYDEALRVSPGHVAALTGRAEIHYRDGRLVDALADLDTAVMLDPDNPEARFNRAVVAMDLGRTGFALEDLEHADRVAPGDADVSERLRRCRELVAQGVTS
ncbi:tetratricopeptide (TPR) repeat protein [Stackebrandtia albiflava]|uniref:Tetratricopeptide (TPR) repeat protein n=1 Tax=Stackebrandtia albiflava TaxID=406432 RepID=A0A562VCD3_9ACTN|nr:tetratricopeptide repeat protein [Stackebrandtia albiflava]TWJ15522.1 tetratricopeptide (TPR) repeat protein [Stackebrandtia albiflava]